MKNSLISLSSIGEINLKYNKVSMILLTMKLIQEYKEIETERRELKELHTKLVNNNGDETLIKGIFKQINNLTFKEANILIGLERKA